MTIASAKYEAELKDRISDVYVVFRGYHLAAFIEPDPCFPNWCDDRPLRAAPLKLLPASAFRVYHWKAITTWGSIEDFKHFLPRLLELLALDVDDGTMRLDQLDRYAIFGKLPYADWRRWPKREKETLDRFFHAWWLAVLARPIMLDGLPGMREEAGDLLADFARLYTDLSPFLRDWEQFLGDEEFGPLAAAHLANWVVQEWERLLQHNGLNWYRFDGVAAQEEQATTWLASEAVCQAMEAAFFRWSDTPYGDLLSKGHDCLNWWLKKRSGTL